MIIVDTAIARHVAAGKPPIRVGMIGAGFMASGVVLQTGGPYRESIRIAAIAARTPSKAVAAYEAAGFEDPAMVDSAQGLARAIEAGRPAVTEDAMLVATSPHIDVLLDVTGAVEDAIAPVLAAIEHGKHVLLMNPELDGTLGPLFKHKADKAGVVFTDVDGDQPGVIGNLHRFVKGLGVRPVLLGNIKGLQDPYRNPTTQKGFAKRWGQNPYLVTSFADGTKVSFEMTVAANASGMTVAKRGMHGYTFEPGTPITQAAKRYDPEEILAGPGIVDYVVGCEPGPGVWALGTIEHPRQRHYLNLYKLGEGPLYCFHTPYHLCHFEVPVTIARAALLQDAAITPLGAPCARRAGDGQARPEGGRGDRRARRLHRLRRGGDRGDHRPRRAAADRRRGRLQAPARHPQGRGADLRRRGDPRRPAGRQAPRRAGRALRPEEQPRPEATAARAGCAPASGGGRHAGERQRLLGDGERGGEARALDAEEIDEARDAVRLGPRSGSRWPGRPRGELRADAGIVGGERPVGELRPVAPDRRVEAVAPARVKAVVDPLDPLGVRPEAPAPGEVERQVRPEPVALGHRVDEVREGHPGREPEVVALAVEDPARPGRAEPLDPRRHLAREEAAGVDEEVAAERHPLAPLSASRRSPPAVREPGAPRGSGSRAPPRPPASSSSPW